MHTLLAQAAAQIPEGIDPMLGWIFALVFGSMTSALGLMWRQAVAESKRKDELIDRLLLQVGRAAEATDRTVSFAEQQDRDRRGGQR